MNRPILVCAFFALAATTLLAQDQSQSSPYQGTSNPPPDDSIITSEQQPAIPKPPAGHPMQPTPATAQPAPQATAANQGTAPVPQTYGDGTDEGIVGVAPGTPALTTRASASDPDDDIVHPAPLRPERSAKAPSFAFAFWMNCRVRCLNRASPSAAAWPATLCKTAR